MKARAKDGEGAVKDLNIFAKAFCSVNSFHLNGDQTKSGYSRYQYRPFTLEGNFAFASGLQEMLIQSYAGFIEVLPAVPAAWKDVAFENLRTEGAFLVSVKKTEGQISEITIASEKGGKTKLKLPFKTWFTNSRENVEADQSEPGFLNLSFKPGAVITIKNGFE
jgi:alpha-L-fucosidase 2